MKEVGRIAVEAPFSDLRDSNKDIIVVFIAAIVIIINIDLCSFASVYFIIGFCAVE